MLEPALSLEGYTVRRLGQADAADLQSLFERCSDYVEIYSGVPPRPSEGADELGALPPGKEMHDKFSLGLYDSRRELVGFIDLMRNYPVENDWWIGLLMLAPAARDQGLGSRVYEAAQEWVRSRERRTIWILVLEENSKAERFWRRQGFEEVRRGPFTAESGKAHTMIEMRHEIPAREPV